MLHYKHILLSTDLEKNSHAIAKKAFEMAQATSAKLSVVHVMESWPVAYGGEFTIPLDINLEQSLETSARKMLTKLAKEFSIEEKNLYLENGSVRFAVINLAEKIKADLIIVGSHNHQGLDILLGSRANAILHHAKCDVLAVRTK